MADKGKLQYSKWTLASEEEQKNIKKAFRFKGYGMLVGYILFLVVILLMILDNIFFQQPNFGFIIFFMLIELATVAGIGNQVKSVREMKHRKFELRDGFVRKINYVSKRKTQISSYEVEVNERNVIKTIVVAKGYRAFRPKVGDQVLLVQPQKTTSIYFYQLIDRPKKAEA